MTPEQTIAAKLARQVGSLTPGFRHVIRLEQVVADGFGGYRRGPHPVGWIERTPGALKIRLVSTEAGRTARALLEEDLLGVVLSDSYPPVVRLTGVAAQEPFSWLERHMTIAGACSDVLLLTHDLNAAHGGYSWGTRRPVAYRRVDTASALARAPPEPRYRKVVVSMKEDSPCVIETSSSWPLRAWSS